MSNTTKLTEAEIESAIADKLSCSLAEANRHLNALKKVLLEEVPARKGFSLGGVLIGTVKVRKARIGRNPKTGETIAIPEKRVISMKAGKILADAVS